MCLAYQIYTNIYQNTLCVNSSEKCLLKSFTCKEIHINRFHIKSGGGGGQVEIKTAEICFYLASSMF